MAALRQWMQAETRTRRLVLAALVYVVCAIVYALVAGPDRLEHHTPYNHYAHLADAWLHGRQDIVRGGPAYAGGNDFAEFEGKTYISFPPFPAVLMLPLVKIAGSPENFRDGQFVIWLAGLGPAFLFLVLEKLRRTGRSSRTEGQNLALAFLFAFGTVYFFTAVEGTVWFAAHVVGVGLCAAYLLVALDAERPLLAGVLLACAWTTRPPMLLLSVFFGFEALRVSCREGLPSGGALRDRMTELWRRLDKKAFFTRCALLSIPLLVSFGVASWMNGTRFREWSPFAFGHEHLGVAWAARMHKWGLFGYHYLAKNLGVALTILPWFPPKGEWCFDHGTPCTPFKINEHGLALWFTTPLYLWLLYPKRGGWSEEKRWLYATLAITAALPAFVDLLYQNSGWRQFGYRFSNDYAILLFVLLALGDRPMRGLFHVAAAWGILWNTFGAATFDKGAFDRFYFRDGSQKILHQPD